MPEVKSRSSPKGKKLRKLRKYLFHYILLAAFCLAIVFVMCYTVFFKLDKIQVTGCSVYSEQQIIEKSAPRKGKASFVSISRTRKKRCAANCRTTVRSRYPGSFQQP